ncbi:MAG: hypothetical protein KDI31_13045, partial [Pseudomonadales bacterium]|nr:hypothetical protein [Pseudomonadales bacterium]
MADTEPGAPVERAFDEFIDQHPASVRLVCWRSGPQQSGTDSQHSGHLEIETKHGQVAVIDHRSGVVYRHPPRPRGTAPEDDRC